MLHHADLGRSHAERSNLTIASRHLIPVVLGWLLAACSGSENKGDPPDNSAVVDASFDGGIDADVPREVLILPDGAQFFPEAGPPTELKVELQINGNNSPCTSCQVLVARVQGGNAPYTYEWSDPTLTGPGPHRVCPGKATTYSVKVTDTAKVSDEFSHASSTVMDDDQLSCSDDENAWAGCIAQTQADAGAPAPMTCKIAEVREPLLNTKLFEFANSFASELPTGADALQVGKMYEFIYDQLLLTFNLGKPVRVNMYGADEPCGDTQHFGEWILDGRPHQGFCFKPEKPWKFIRVDIDIGDTFFYFEFIPAAGTTCLGCSSEK